MKPRKATITRVTKETSILVKINLDGTGKYQIETGLGFFDHLLQILAKYSEIDLLIKAKGDLFVDEHHTVEDVGITLGETILKALGSKKGLERFGFMLPMDEVLAETAIDLGGRSYLIWKVKFKREKIGDLPTELLEDFFKAVSDNLKANIHINIKYGRNEHHKAEAIFKAFGRTLRMAKIINPKSNLLPTTKGKI